MAAKPEDIIRDEIRAMAPYHVADAAGMVKLDAMENPYRLTQAARERLASVVANAELNRYPDPAARRLKARLRESLGLSERTAVLLGNGSDEIIQMLTMAVAKPGAVVLGVEPAFVMFRMVATLCGVRFVGVPLAQNFELDTERLLSAVREHKPALIFLAYPNNPTGNLFDERAIARLLEAAPGLVVIDEAYHAFAGRTYIEKLDTRPNLLVMRTLSKSGLAGLRLGFVAGAQAWLEHVEKIRLPYNVGVLTQLVAEQALQQGALLDEQAAAIKAERTRLYDELKRIPGIIAYPSEANFILFKTDAADELHAELKRHGILVKNLHGSHPALQECLRVTVGTPDENSQFLTALRASAK